MAHTVESRRVASRKRFSLAPWLDAHTSATLPLLISVVALGAAGIAVILAHRGRTTTATTTSAAVTVSARELQSHGWRNASATTESSAGYYRTSDGRVFLTGTLSPLKGTRPTLFELPPAYRPSRTVIEPIAVGRSLGSVSVLQSGNVVLLHLPSNRPDVVSLDGVSFLAQSTPPLFVPQNLLHQYGWTSASTSTGGQAGYYKAPDGRVFLTGTLRPLGRVTSNSTAFVLPGGYRPPRALVQPVVAGTSFGTVTVQPTGGVVLNVPSTHPKFVSLDGVSFLPGS